MSNARRVHHTYDHYLEVERMSDVRHEFLDGEIYAMAGGTPEHGILAMRLGALLAAQLAPGCRVASSDVKVSIRATGLSTYPDVSVICAPLDRDPRDANAITNPSLLAEVPSPSTEDYDRGDKLSHYKQVPSLEAVVFVSHGAPRVTVVERTTDGSTTTDARPGEIAALATLGLSIDVSTLHASLEGLG